MKRSVWIPLGLACALLAPQALWAQAALDTQLLANPGAEDGASSADGMTVTMVPGWSTSGTNFTVVAYTAAGFGFSDPQVQQIGGGKAFFAGGPGNPASQATQDVDLSAVAADIDAGGVNAVLGAYMAGFAGQGDNGTVTVSFLDAAKNRIGDTIVLGPQAGSKSQWVQYQDSGPVPPGARTARVSLFAQRVEGAYNDAYFDNLSLVLTKNLPPPTLPTPMPIAAPIGQELLINGDAESGPGAYNGEIEPIPAWTVKGNATVVQYGGPPPPGIDEAARIGGGTNLFSLGLLIGKKTSLSQVVDLTPYAGDVDAGKLRVHFSVLMDAGAKSTYGAYVQQLDAMGQVLDTLDANSVRATNNTLVLRVREAPLLPGARFAQVVLTNVEINSFDDTEGRGYFDNVSLKLAPALALPAPIAAAAPAPVSYGANLLTDPGAEDALPGPGYRVIPIPGWTTTGNFTAVNYFALGNLGAGLTMSLDRRPSGQQIMGGNRYFAGGPGSHVGAVGTASQTVDVTSYASDIDGGRVRAHAEAQMAGYQEEGDNGLVIVSFLDAGLKPLGTVLMGPVHGSDPAASAYSLQKSDTPVPPGTRSIQYTLAAQKLERLDGGFFFGISNDAFFDNLVLSLNLGASNLPGDVNGDGVVDVGDTTLVLRAALGLVVLTPDEMKRADVTGDGEVTVADVTVILRMVVASLLGQALPPLMPPVMPPVMPPAMQPLTFTATATATPATVPAGGQVSIAATFAAMGQSYTGITDLEIYDAAGNKVAQQDWKDQTLTPGAPLSFTFDWTANVPPGTYSVQLGVFNPAFTDNPYYNNAAATITVTAAPGM